MASNLEVDNYFKHSLLISTRNTFGDFFSPTGSYVTAAECRDCKTLGKNFIYMATLRYGPFKQTSKPCFVATDI